MGHQYLGVFGCALLLTACASSPKPPTPAQTRAHYDQIQKAFDNAGPTPEQFALAGMQEVDVRCDRYFADVAQHNHRTAGVQKGVSFLGSSVTGVMGATGEAADDIAVAALIFSGLDAQIGNYREYELLGPVAGSAQQLVRKARDAYRQVAIPNDPVRAARHVHDYAQLCTFDTIISFVNAAVEKATPVVQTRIAAKVAEADRLVVTSALTVHPAVGIAALTDGEWAELFVLLENIPTTPALIVQLATRYPALRPVLVSVDGKTLTDAGTAVFAQLGALRQQSPVFRTQTEALRASLAAALRASAQGAGGSGSGAMAVSSPISGTTFPGDFALIPQTESGATIVIQ